MDLGRSSYTARVMDDNITSYKARLRVVLAQLRVASSGIQRSETPSSGDRSSPTLSSEVSNNSGYKPYMERLKPPTFSGKVEDWPEFRSVWKELLAGYPDSIQVQHLKTHIPAADVKRVAGINTMVEICQCLEKVYGDTELNIITVKTNLENYIPKPGPD